MKVIIPFSETPKCRGYTLRLSLRSFCENFRFEFEPVLVTSNPPSWYSGKVINERNRSRLLEMKDANMLAKIVAGAAAYDEAEFIVANDDHIALKPAQHCDLLPVEIPDGYRLPRPSPYIQNVKRTRDHVKQLGSSPQRVEGHLPILLSRSSIHEAGDSEIVSNGIIWQDLAVGLSSKDKAVRRPHEWFKPIWRGDYSFPEIQSVMSQCRFTVIHPGFHLRIAASDVLKIFEARFPDLSPWERFSEPIPDIATRRPNASRRSFYSGWYDPKQLQN